MVVEFHYAFELVDKVVYSLGFVIESFFLRCLNCSRLSYMFFSCIWFKNIWLIHVVGTRSLVLMIVLKIFDDYDYNVLHRLMEIN